MRSWAIFDPPIQGALHSLKYRRNFGIADSLACELADFFRSLKWTVDVLIPAPLSIQRQKDRGYNQVGLVARPFAYETGLKYVPQGLIKKKDTRSQVGLSISERKNNVLGVYLANSLIVTGKSILLLDDVATTGSTIQACTEALLAAGARDVYVITIARALSHHDMNRV